MFIHVCYLYIKCIRYWYFVRGEGCRGANFVCGEGCRGANFVKHSHECSYKMLFKKNLISTLGLRQTLTVGKTKCKKRKNTLGSQCSTGHVFILPPSHLNCEVFTEASICRQLYWFTILHRLCQQDLSRLCMVT